MLSNNEMRKYINRISFRSLLKTSLSHQVPSYHDLHLGHHYSTTVIDIMNHLQTNEQKKWNQTKSGRHMTQNWLFCVQIQFAQDPWRCRLVVQRKSRIPREASTWYDSTALSRCTIERSLWKEGACLHFRCETPKVLFLLITVFFNLGMSFKKDHHIGDQNK